MPIIAVGRPSKRAVDVRDLGAELDRRDVADAQEGAVGLGAQHDALELGGVGQPALGLEVELEQRVVGHRLGADPADRRLDVLRLERRDDVARASSPRLVSRSTSSTMRIE